MSLSMEARRRGGGPVPRHRAAVTRENIPEEFDCLSVGNFQKFHEQRKVLHRLEERGTGARHNDEDAGTEAEGKSKGSASFAFACGAGDLTEPLDEKSRQDTGDEGVGKREEELQVARPSGTSRFGASDAFCLTATHKIIRHRYGEKFPHGNKPYGTENEEIPDDEQFRKFQRGRTLLEEKSGMVASDAGTTQNNSKDSFPVDRHASEALAIANGVISGKESGFLEMFQAFSPEERAVSTSLSRPDSTTIHDFTEQELVQAGKLLRLLKLRMQRNDKYSSSAGAQGKHPFARIDGAVSRTKRGNDGGKKRAQHETENAVRHDRQFRTSGGRAEQGKLEKSPERRTQEEEKFPTDHWEGCDLRRLSRELKKAPCFARVSEKKERGEPGWRERLTSSSLEEEKFPFSFRKESTRSHRVHSNSRDTLRKSLSAAFDETCSPSALSEFSLPEKAGTYPARRSNCEAEHLIPLSSSVCRRNASPSREDNPEDDLCCAVGLACGTSSRESDSSAFSLSRASCQLGSCSDTGVRMPLEKTQTTARVNSSSLLAGRLCESSQLEFETVPRTARSEGAGEKQQRKHGPPPDRIAICRLASGQAKRGKVKRTERTTRSSTVSGTEQRSTDTEQERFASLPSRSSVSEWNKNKSEREPLSTKSTFDQLPSDESDSVPCASDAEGKDDAENERSEAERECPDCGRTFISSSFEKHVKVCHKVFMTKRKEYNIAGKRLAIVAESTGVALPRSPTQAGSKSVTKEEKPMSKWRRQSEQFRAAMRMARVTDPAEVAAAQATFAKYSESSATHQCRHCSRTFGRPEALKKHESVCLRMFKSGHCLRKGEGISAYKAAAGARKTPVRNLLSLSGHGAETRDPRRRLKKSLVDPRRGSGVERGAPGEAKEQEEERNSGNQRKAAPDCEPDKSRQKGKTPDFAVRERSVFQEPIGSKSPVSDSHASRRAFSKTRFCQ